MKKMKEKNRAKAQIKFGGSPEPFPASDLPTYHDICQFWRIIILQKLWKYILNVVFIFWYFQFLLFLKFVYYAQKNELYGDHCQIISSQGVKKRPK